MDDITLLAAASCAILAALVYLMWQSAVKAEWQALTRTEKTKWRTEEENLKEGKGSA